MSYSLAIVPSARKEILDLPDMIVKRVDTAISRLSDTARPHGCVKLKGIDAYRIRVGNYRIIYGINDKLRQIKILAVGHRRDIYR